MKCAEKMPVPPPLHEPAEKGMASKILALQRASVFSSAESSSSGEASLNRWRVGLGVPCPGSGKSVKVAIMMQCIRSTGCAPDMVEPVNGVGLRGLTKVHKYAEKSRQAPKHSYLSRTSSSAGLRGSMPGMRASVMKGGRAPKAPAEIPLGTSQRVGTLLIYLPISRGTAHVRQMIVMVQYMCHCCRSLERGILVMLLAVPNSR